MTRRRALLEDSTGVLDPGQPTADTAALRATDLYRFFRAGDEETLALRGVSVTVSRGETVAVVGPSGSGKSTLLACLAGLDEPSGGTVHVNGERMSHQPEAVRARLRASSLGLLGQSDNLFSHLTVAANIRLVQSLVSDRHRPDVASLLASLGIADRRDSYPQQLSGGELARAGLAVALANDPAVVIADEPTGELDGDTERRLISLLLRRAAEGCAVIVASHSAVVRRMADRVIVLAEGRQVG